MKTVRFGNYKFNGLDFEKRPKGELFRFGVNPYNGLVQISVSKHRESTKVALDLMRKLVWLCDVIEWHEKDPLEFLMSHDWDNLSLESLIEAARWLYIEELKGGLEDGTDNAADSGATVKKAS